jgi:hypothetical protein
LYYDALRESGDPILKQMKVHVAISACLGRLSELLSELPPEKSSERTAISVALGDLKVVRDVRKRQVASLRETRDQGFSHSTELKTPQPGLE